MSVIWGRSVYCSHGFRWELLIRIPSELFTVSCNSCQWFRVFRIISKKNRYMGCKYNCWEMCRISRLCLRCWDSSYHLEYHCLGALSETDGVRDIWYHFKSANVVQEGIIHLLDQVKIGCWQLAFRSCGIPLQSMSFVLDTQKSIFLALDQSHIG